MRGTNRAGGFIRLGVVDAKRKSFSIFIPKGGGNKGGWVTMAEKIQQMEGAMVEKQIIRVKVRREETLGNLRKLEHCIVASWKSSAEGGEDLEKLGRLMANSWGLKGNLGLARLEKNRVLLEFDALEEARRVLSSGKRLLGGLQLGLEHWNPRIGCWVEEELRKEVWVKIVGLPISLWNLTILRRVEDECGDFMPSGVEIEVEEFVYYLMLWWELRPKLRKELVDGGEASGRKSGEVRGEAVSSTGLRVEEESGSARLETLTLSVEVMDGPEASPSTRWQAEVVDCSKRVGFDGLERTEPFDAWEIEDFRKQQLKVSYLETDRALEEEALRYGSVSYSRGKRVLGVSYLNSLSFDQALEGEFYDRSEIIGEEFRSENTMWLTAEEGPNEDGNGYWVFEEDNRINDKARGAEGDSGMLETQVVRNENEEKWKESSLAKFIHFLGYPTEGLEKEILSFLIKSERDGRGYTTKNFWRGQSSKGN
ncbi:hypothetical protein CK203_050260 [Vitis vinifera]|uniref:DUF4283 domain-containing protein n=1 Tax=Vitis vinifera TaxID=29760 RepID=A0A438GZ53_VITVI|nr:hypothetical protein CK203_050260 [Vitis vinifera]